MNKLLNKIAIAFVGMAMAIGVGVAVGQRSEVKRADAANGDLIASGSFLSSTPSGWTASHSEYYSSNNGFKMKAVGNNIISPSIASQSLTQVKVGIKAGHNGGSGSVLTVYACDKDGNALEEGTKLSGTVTPTQVYTTAVGSITEQYVELVASSAISTIKVQMTSKTNNLGLKLINIYDNSPAADPSSPTITITNDAISGKVGDTVSLTYSDTNTESFTSKNVVWSVPAGSIATIDGSTLTFIKNGDDVNVTATLRDGETEKATATKATALLKPAVSIKESGSVKTRLTVARGESVTLDKSATNVPSSNASYVWTHSGSAGSFNASTLQYSASSVGSDTITVSLKYNDTVIATSTLKIKVSIAIDQSEGAYHLIANASELYNGAHITLANADHTYGFGVAKKSNYGASDITYDSGSKSIVLTDDEHDTLTDIELEQEGDYWRFCVGDDSYLYASSSSSNELKANTLATVGDNGLWSITITDGVFAIAAQGTNTRDDLFYNPNNGSPLFACYNGSAPTGGSTVAVYLYKTYESEMSAYATAFIKGDGSSNSCAKTIETWSTHKANFAKLSAGARGLFAEATHDEISTYDGSTAYTVANCVARYDDAVRKNVSLQTAANEFMGRFGEGKVNPSYASVTEIGALNNQNNSATIVIIIVSIAGITAIGGYLLLRRRKEQ